MPREYDPKTIQLAVDTIKTLSIDAVEKANSGHPGTPMGLSDIAFELASTHRAILSGPERGQIPFRLEGRPMRVVFPLLRFLATRVLTMSTPLARSAASRVPSSKW